MSFNISSVGPAAGQTGSDQRSKPCTARGPGRRVRQDADASVKVDTFPSSPPPEVHAAMGVAADAYDKLEASGPRTELPDRLTAPASCSIEVHDLKGHVLFTASAEQGARHRVRRKPRLASIMSTNPINLSTSTSSNGSLLQITGTGVGPRHELDHHRAAGDRQVSRSRS